MKDKTCFCINLRPYDRKCVKLNIIHHSDASLICEVLSNLIYANMIIIYNMKTEHFVRIKIKSNLIIHKFHLFWGLKMIFSIRTLVYDSRTFSYLPLILPRKSIFDRALAMKINNDTVYSVRTLHSHLVQE